MACLTHSPLTLFFSLWLSDIFFLNQRIFANQRVSNLMTAVYRWRLQSTVPCRVIYSQPPDFSGPEVMLREQVGTSVAILHVTAFILQKGQLRSECLVPCLRHHVGHPSPILEHLGLRLKCFWCQLPAKALWEAAGGVSSHPPGRSEFDSGFLDFGPGFCEHLGREPQDGRYSFSLSPF